MKDTGHLLYFRPVSRGLYADNLTNPMRWLLWSCPVQMRNLWLRTTQPGRGKDGVWTHEVCLQDLCTSLHASHHLCQSHRAASSPGTQGQDSGLCCSCHSLLFREKGQNTSCPTLPYLLPCWSGVMSADLRIQAPAFWNLHLVGPTADIFIRRLLCARPCVTCFTHSISQQS